MEVGGKRLDNYTVTEPCEPCQEGNVSTQADGYCINCEEYICQTCFLSHLKLKLCRNHVLGALDGEKSQVTQKLEEKCNKHTMENIKYYCRNHDFVGCGDCIVSDHRQCEPEFIKDLAKNYEESSEFKTLLKRTQEWNAVKAEAEKRIENDRKVNNILVDNAVREIKNFRTEINDWLNKMEARLVEEVRKMSDDNEIQISKQEKNIKSVSEKMCDIMEELNPNANSGDKLFIRTVECKPKICDIDKAVSEIKSGYVIKSYTFEPETNMREMLASSVKLGIIKIARKKREKKQTTMVESSATDIDKLPGADNYRGIALFDRDTGSPGALPIRHDALSQEMPEFQIVDIGYCVICMDELENPKTLKCGHSFCTDCIAEQFKFNKKCPTCGVTCGIIIGDQPGGRMVVNVNKYDHCAGYEDCGRIEINYNFPSGRQQENHPNPGKVYKGISRRAYLPDNKEGNEVLQLLKIAFERKLVFTIGISRTTGEDGVITWNDIHHKTDPRPNSQFGYPDPGYLASVKDDLAANGVTLVDINK